MIRMKVKRNLRAVSGERFRAGQISLLTTREAAEFFGIHEETFKQWRRRGRGPRYFKPGPRKRNGMVRYRVDDLEAFVASSMVEPVPSSTRVILEARVDNEKAAKA